MDERNDEQREQQTEPLPPWAQPEVTSAMPLPSEPEVTSATPLLAEPRTRSSILEWCRLLGPGHPSRRLIPPDTWRLCAHERRARRQPARERYARRLRPRLAPGVWLRVRHLPTRHLPTRWLSSARLRNRRLRPSRLHTGDRCLPARRLPARCLPARCLPTRQLRPRSQSASRAGAS